MAHWSSGYADFHEELYAEPLIPSSPPLLRCTECGATLDGLDAVREHMFLAHPISHPVLIHRGRFCGDARLLVQRPTEAKDWTAVNCTSVRINDDTVSPTDLGPRLSTARGVVDVQLYNDRSNRKYEFDFAIAHDDDLHGVDAELIRAIKDGDIASNSISTFYERSLEFSTAQNYSGGIAEYLYWMASRRAETEITTAVRNRDKLNNAAHLLSDIFRPAALAITSLISFHFNHFEDAAHRALSPGLRDVSARMDRMLTSSIGARDIARIDGELSQVEKLLVDEKTASLLVLCSLPLDSSTTRDVAEFARSDDPYDQLKAHLFAAEHHLATGDTRAEQLVRTARQNGLSERWLNARLDLITEEGSIWHTAPAAAAPANSAPLRKANGTTATASHRTTGPDPTGTEITESRGNLAPNRHPTPTPATMPARTPTTTRSDQIELTIPPPGNVDSTRKQANEAPNNAAASQTGEATTKSGNVTATHVPRDTVTATIPRATRPTNAVPAPRAPDTPLRTTPEVVHTRAEHDHHERTTGTEPRRKSSLGRPLPRQK
ncbi:hypothetical protein DVG80_20655 [Rhodococcus erythropolis]|nr:hypothetical protein DVG80_20655 [Rhodococcus erythropolis]